MKDPAAKAAYDRARYRRLHVDSRRTACLGCGDPVRQPRHGRRLYCTRACLERAWWAARRGAPLGPMPAPYTGHQWLERARALVLPDTMELIPGTELTDRIYDEMGEAVLALLEGRDPVQAVRDFRRQEYVPRHLTKHLSNWPDAKALDAIMPYSPSAEDVFVGRKYQ